MHLMQQGSERARNTHARTQLEEPGGRSVAFASKLRCHQESGVLMFAFRKVTLETVQRLDLNQG